MPERGRGRKFSENEQEKKSVFFFFLKERELENRDQMPGQVEWLRMARRSVKAERPLVRAFYIAAY